MALMSVAPRQLSLCIGSPPETASRAAALVGDGAVWVSARDEAGAVPPSRMGSLLGVTVPAVVIDGHGGLDPELLGQCQGLVGRGGRLVVRLDPEGADAPSNAAWRQRLAPWPFGPEAVGDRMQRRLRRHLGEAALQSPLVASSGPARRAAAGADAGAIADQDTLVAALAEHLTAGPRRHAALIAPRGRGKSATLGRLLGKLLNGAWVDPDEVVLASPDVGGLETLVAFAAAAGVPTPPETRRPDDLAAPAPSHAARRRLILLDEAARTPVPILRRIALAHPEASLVFATTTDGYEGTGQGFVLRFLAWLRSLPGSLELFHPSRPMRWDEGDPIERAVDAALLLRASPAPDDAFGPAPCAADAIHAKLDQAALAADEGLLKEVFGLLRYAHYRTTTRDVELLLDAPNMHLHLLLLHGHVAAICLVAEEGGLDAALTEAVATGRHRLRAHALADNLVAHMGLRDAGPLKMLRSVRIATHPGLRRLGLAARLVEAVHRHHAPDLFGTVFGAEPGVIAFRQRLGYAVVRVSASRGARTGEPSVVMLRAASAQGARVLEAARADFAWGWPVRRRLLAADGLPLEAALDAALETAAGPREPSADEAPLAAHARRIAAYLEGSMTFEQVAPAVVAVLGASPDALKTLPHVDAALLAARAGDARGWPEVAGRAGLPHAGAAMRRMRAAVGALMSAMGTRAPI